MTGVAFGIMAHIAAFKEPCKSGYHNDKNLKETSCSMGFRLDSQNKHACD